MNAVFPTDERFAFAVTPDELWAVLMDTRQWTSWWEWLERCELEALEAGQHTAVRIAAPLGYHLDVDVEIVALEPGSFLCAQVTGDLVGPARLDLTATPEGCVARVSWSLEVQGAVMSRAAAAGRPIVEASHRHVMEAGREDFDEVLADRGLPTTLPAKQG